MNFLTALKMAWVWRSKARTARIFYGFAKAEQASMVDMESAASLTSSVERASLYLQHASDETHHARMFLGRAQKLREEENDAPFDSLYVDTEDLFEVWVKNASSHLCTTAKRAR
ncbi:MAG: hypothetical protein GY822_17935 [Deltaproteobacteria bacterium]|nr:hypothetical protein [Deltaproteobacteria bacterium]